VLNIAAATTIVATTAKTVRNFVNAASISAHLLSCLEASVGSGPNGPVTASKRPANEYDDGARTASGLRMLRRREGWSDGGAVRDPDRKPRERPVPAHVGGGDLHEVAPVGGRLRVPGRGERPTR
jgi:hypothetical protein